MKTYFLFDGGNYKLVEDNGRERSPLTDVESQMIVIDPELPGDTDNSIGSELVMSKYADLFCDLEVGDEIMVGLVPDVTLIRGLWLGNYDAVDGFQVTADLVSVRDVYKAHADGSTDSVPPFEGVSLLNFDFSNGLGDATKDAVYKASMTGKKVSDYRNEDALKLEVFPAPVFAGLGQSTYLRIKVNSLGSLGSNSTDGCCNSCGDVTYPRFKVGVVYDNICFDKQRVRDFCNCEKTVCSSGCDDKPKVTVDGPTLE